MYGHTAAHKWFPLGPSCVFATLLQDVRINDRGPYIGGRELDLSYGAAAQIGLLDSGVGYTTVTYI